MSEPERLQKLLARAGLGSRRECEQFVAEGRVRVNGAVVELGARADPEADVVEVDGIRIPLTPNLTYLALHKPPGVVTTARDPHGRETVFDLVPDDPRVFPVGRLDRDTSGLLLLTNDGEFANRIAHPRYEVPKTYIVEVRGRVDRRHLTQLRRGVELDDGRASVDSVRILDRIEGRTLLELVVHEGRKRMLRRMCEALGFEVISLVRTAIGPLGLGRLKERKWRKLGGTEVLQLLRSAESGADRSRGSGRAP